MVRAVVKCGRPKGEHISYRQLSEREIAKLAEGETIEAERERERQAKKAARVAALHAVPDPNLRRLLAEALKVTLPSE